MSAFNILSNYLAAASVLFIGLLYGCSNQPVHTINSPDQLLKLHVDTNAEGKPGYTLSYKGNTIIDTSYVGFEFGNSGSLVKNMEISNTATRLTNESWNMIWGEQETVINKYNELLVELEETDAPHRLMNIRFRVFDDGVGFRYEFPKQDGFSPDVEIMREFTRFSLTGDHTAWWIPADYDSYEYTYSESKMSEIDASELQFDLEDRPDRMIANPHAVNTPVTMKTDDGLYLSFHEANLTDYAGMTLAISKNNTLESELVPWADGTKVKTKIPFKSPWRTVQIAETPGDLIASKLILNLNEPNKLNDTSYLEPMKYTGIWWEMHIGKTSWALEEAAEGSFSTIGGKNIHGANTENAKKYIDFNQKSGLRGMLVEGWNTGWEYWGVDSVGFFDFTTSYPDFNLREVAEYARENDVALIGHHETSGQAAHYETRLDSAFQLYQDVGVKAVKTGYAGGIIPRGERHHGQYMVRHYRTVVKKAAEYGIMINAHEPVKDTGIRRTYPNMMTREGVRGMEFNAWSNGNPPDHTTILPFTRMLAGPIDYTQGIFNLTFDEYRDKERVHTTLAKQLALFVTIYSPMQMAADLPEHYTTNEGNLHPVFSFIQEVGVDWSESHVLNAEIGDYITMIRKERDTDRWFLGSITDEHAREFEIKTDFLDSNTMYEAIIYKDGADAHWKDNPHSFEIAKIDVDNSSAIKLDLAPGGGTAISFVPK